LAIFYNPRIITDNLVLALDAGNTKSYPGSGTTWTDLSGNGNTGTLTNGPTYSSANGGMFTFNGTNQYITVPSSASITTSTPTVIVGCTIGTGSVLAKGGYGSYWNYGINGLTSTAFSARNTNCDSASGSVFTSKSGYAIFAARYNGTGIDFYRDGVYGSTITGGCYSPTASNSLFLTIGRAQDNAGNGTEFYSGSISFLQIYNRALTADEISQNFNALRSRFSL
jgi:hypothetical protein